MVAGDDGLDEVSIAATTKVLEVNGPEISRYEIAPSEVGVRGCDDSVFAADCAGGTPEHNAALTRAILGAGDDGEASAASVELAVINAGAAIYAAGAADSIADGVLAAREALAGGSAAEALESYVRASNAAAGAEPPL